MDYHKYFKSIPTCPTPGIIWKITGKLQFSRQLSQVMCCEYKNTYTGYKCHP
jgi:hypothetical protein